MGAEDKIASELNRDYCEKQIGKGGKPEEFPAWDTPSRRRRITSEPKNSIKSAAIRRLTTKVARTRLVL